METYRELRSRQQEEFNSFPIGAAFSDKQFEEMRKKWGINKKDIKEKIVSIGAGCFIRKDDTEKYIEMCKRHRQEMQDAINADESGEGFIFQMFYEEMANHEFVLTYDTEEVLSACGLDWHKVNCNQRLAHGFNIAKTKILEEE